MGKEINESLLLKSLSDLKQKETYLFINPIRENLKMKQKETSIMNEIKFLNKIKEAILDTIKLLDPLKIETYSKNIQNVVYQNMIPKFINDLKSNLKKEEKTIIKINTEFSPRKIIEKNFTEKTTIQKIVDFMKLNPLLSYSIRDIAQHLGKSEANIRVSLKRETDKPKSQIELLKKKKGKQKLYHISARSEYEHRIEHLERKLEEMKYFEIENFKLRKRNKKLKEENKNLKKE